MLTKAISAFLIKQQANITIYFNFKMLLAAAGTHYLPKNCPVLSIFGLVSKFHWLSWTWWIIPNSHWSISSHLLEMLDGHDSVQVSPFVMNSPYILAHASAFSHSLGLNQGWHGERNRWAPLMTPITKGLAVERWAWGATNSWTLILMGVLPFWIPDVFGLALIFTPSGIFQRAMWFWFTSPCLDSWESRF